MLTAEESAERRALQRALYAPGGSLTGVQRARLAELDARHLGG